MVQLVCGSPKRKRRKRSGILGIGKWPSAATAAVPAPARRIAMTTTPYHDEAGDNRLNPCVVHGTRCNQRST
jgi:hypothetical protein